ncbi:hypothetical protein [Nodosilinea sp. E11]|uniref:hypothetical protein n=1 Tax=Nodosilinea sp. E11 TaxID=3037479 RepID=UPI00293416BD|nr:hypothetical protein [Nodosilinea sp. E11]WOD39842.1 hypothetical protein RRF56_03445 [Nodosilinea sp. E11]
MVNKYLLSTLTAGALAITLAACEPRATTPEVVPPTTEAPGQAPGTTEVGDRADYNEVPVPEDDSTVGTDPTQIALAVFGSTEPGEGNFTEYADLIEETDAGALVLLTQTGLADDSVNGMRYRLEFVPEGDQWRLDWAGQQARCQPGRGSEDWTTDLCN